MWIDVHLIYLLELLASCHPGPANAPMLLLSSELLITHSQEETGRGWETGRLCKNGKTWTGKDAIRWRPSQVG